MKKKKAKPTVDCMTEIRKDMLKRLSEAVMFGKPTFIKE